MQVCKKPYGAILVWDGDMPWIPILMGQPREDQLAGTWLENLAELAGRVCYDSLGTGRATKSKVVDGSFKQGYHDHILQVKHGSVYEHGHFTVEFTDQHMGTYIPCLVGRPGIHVVFKDPNCLRITANLRAVLEWDSFQSPEWLGHGHRLLQKGLVHHANQLAPLVVKDTTSPVSTMKLVEPEYDSEKWISLFMWGSRGFSHEQVRHGDFSAISQRSTRFVDESESEWVDHPLITEFVSDATETAIPTCARECKFHAKQAYQITVQELEAYMIDQGVDALSARKQARGAARGYLGNALETQMIFTANVPQWHRMLQQRCSRFADAEIRMIYNDVLPILQGTKYWDCFKDYELVDSPDKIGKCLK